MQDVLFTRTQISVIIILGLLAVLNYPVGQAAIMTLVITAAVFVYTRGWWNRFGHFLLRVFNRLRHAFDSDDAGWAMYDVLLGYDEATGEPIIENLENLKSGIFAGTSGFGKTTWAQQFVDRLITTHSANDLKLAIGDVKQVSFSVWRNIPHLFCPIAETKEEHAQMLQLVLDEMEHRKRQFKVYSDHFCESLADYYRLSGVRLPRLVVIVDELADAVQPGDDAYAHLVTLAKQGRFVGIHLFLGTQRPSAQILTGDVVSQTVTRLFAYMPNNREFGVVSMIPKSLYEQATPTPGRFMVYTTRGQWRFMQVKRTSRREMARRAKRLSGRRRSWGQVIEEVAASQRDVMAAKTEWSGSNEEKTAMLRAWMLTLDHEPTLEEIMGRYSISKPTAVKFRQLVRDEE